MGNFSIEMVPDLSRVSHETFFSSFFQKRSADRARDNLRLNCPVECGVRPKLLNLMAPPAPLRGIVLMGTLSWRAHK